MRKPSKELTMGNCAESPSTEATEVAAEAPEVPPLLPEGVIEVKLTKDSSEKLGLDISHSADKKCVKVKGIKEGCVETWNKANPGKMIEPGDLLIEINGAKDDSEEMLKMIKGANSIEFKVQKASPP